MTRLKDNAVYQGLEDIDIPDEAPLGCIKDEKISISYKDELKKEQTLMLRRVVFYDEDKKRILQFLTNIFDMSTQEIGQLYKLRLQIELLFKQLKQNFPTRTPLKYSYVIPWIQPAFYINQERDQAKNMIFKSG